MKRVFLVIDHYITTIFIKLLRSFLLFLLSGFLTEFACHTDFCSFPRKPFCLPDVLCVHVRLIGGFFFKLGIWFLCYRSAGQKLISSQSKKEVENFICRNLSDYNLGDRQTVFLVTVLGLLEVRIQLAKFLRQRGYMSGDTDSSHNPGLHVQSEKWDILIP